MYPDLIRRCTRVQGFTRSGRVFVVSLTYTYLGLNDLLHLVSSNLMILPCDKGNERSYQSIHVKYMRSDVKYMLNT